MLTGGGELSISIFDDDGSANPVEPEYPEEPEELEYREELKYPQGLVGRHNLVSMGGGKFSI